MNIAGTASTGSSAVRSVESRSNNFDLIRLAAATQVLLLHSIEHLKVPVGAVAEYLIGIFSGVPIFFVVSGFLISASLRRSSGRLRDYAANRAVRIFPGLWACFAFCVASLWLYGEFADAGLPTLAAWVLANAAGVSFSPAFVKSFGVGHVNGSLWTIPVELQFYVVLPLLAAWLGVVRWRWAVLFGLAVAVFFGYYTLITSDNEPGWRGAATRALPTWLYLFMVGMFLEWRRDLVDRFLAGRALYWLVGYLAWTWLLWSLGVRVTGNFASPLASLPLGLLVVSAAFTRRDAADRLLRRNDISYGIYLYHMPVVNILLEENIQGHARALATCAAVTLVLALLSWRFVERPMLRRRRAPTG